MNESRRTVDARGLACPQPVILTRNTLAEGGFDLLEVLVDDPSSRDNVARFATYIHCTVEQVVEEAGAFRLVIRPNPSDQSFPTPPRVFAQPEPVAPGPRAREAQGTTVVLTGRGIGNGDPELGALLMRGFLHTLTEAEILPARIILMNGGVHLAVAGAETLASLVQLGHQGVEILACGTCLEFYALKDQLAVGRVTNLYEIAERLLRGPVVQF
jgi:selenium metabolism protein YedF